VPLNQSRDAAEPGEVYAEKAARYRALSQSPISELETP
jgi:hypothetical protein